jgi:uncharacterized heparinase superfamily protein
MAKYSSPARKAWMAKSRASRLEAVHNSATMELPESPAQHFRQRALPRWRINWREHPRLSGKPFVPPPPEADDYLQRKFTFRLGQRDWTAQFKDKIDWAANPTSGDEYNPGWNCWLHRHYYFPVLAEAYWNTGEERYAEALAAQWMDWIQSNPRPQSTSGNDAPGGNYSWQTLTTGRRLERTWLDSLYRCLASPAFDDEVLRAIAHSVREQAQHLMKWHGGGNWLTTESLGLYTAGLMFPEFEEAAEWRRTGIARLHRQLETDIYPDGMQFELALGYNCGVLRLFCQLLERAALNHRGDEIPSDFRARLEKMFDYLLYARMPDGRVPGLNDSHYIDIADLMARGSELFPERKDFQWAATRSKEGSPPRGTSHAFPYTGHFVMRSGWDADAQYLLFDAGPAGHGHRHEDKLHFVLAAHGRQHILDAGHYSYDQSRWRRYMTGSAAHNTILVDGEGQNRASQPATHGRPKPWDKPAPIDNDSVWISRDEYDFARGVYRDGYGPDLIGVIHTRRILFVKPEYFVIQDTLTPPDNEEYFYESLFHFDAETAIIDDSTLAVTTCNEGESTLIVWPLASEGLSLRLAQGEKNPVQGWANEPVWRSVPTAIYSRRARGVTRFLQVLFPKRRNQRDPVIAVEDQSLPGMPALAVRFANGGSDLIAFNEAPGSPVTVGEHTFSSETFLLRQP